MDNEILLKVEHMYKSFRSTKALVDVSMEIRPGEVRGLIGENGSGKSTLASIIAGAQKCDAGTMQIVGGEPYAPKDTVDAAKKGVCMIVQEQGTLNGLTVAANVFLGKEQLFLKNGLMQVGRMNDETKRILADIGVTHIHPATVIDKVPFEDRKLIEMARAMYTKPRLLIVDETTTALPRKGREILYALMKRMREEGDAVLFISHDIEEVIEHCNVATILRDGQVTGVLRKEEMQPDSMKRLMVGRDVSEHFYRTDYDSSHQQSVALSIEGINTNVLKDISIDLYKGEIVGIGGLTDCGMHELGKVAYGLLPRKSGVVKTGDGVVIDGVKTALDNKVGYLSKDRDQEALMLVGSIEENICLPSLDIIKKHGLILKRYERDFIKEWVEKLSIKMRSPDQFCMYLSGGNKQKVSLAKWLANGSKILILDCPTRGIDVGVKADIYHLMVALKKQGKSILMISEELPELIGMCDRMILIKRGKITKQFQRSEELSENSVIEYII